MTNTKKHTQILGCLFCVFAAVLFTCESVPEYCGKGTGKNSWLKEGQFCFGDAAYNTCTGKSYNPLVEGCDPNSDVGTKCQDGSAVPKGTPCGGYTLTTAVTPTQGGNITRTPPETEKTNFAAGDQIVLIATPEDEYTFIGWAGAATSIKNETAEVTMSGSNSNKPIVAMFKPKDTPNTTVYTLTATAFPEYGGEIARNPNAATYNPGEQVTLNATAKPGYTFDGWSGNVTSEKATVSVSMNESKTLVAIFTSIIYKIKASANPEAGGAVFVNGAALAGNTSRDVGTEIVVWASPADGYSFIGWSGAAEAAGSNNPATIKVTNNGMTIIANFKKGNDEIPVTPPQIVYTLTADVSPSNGGSVSLNPDATNYAIGTPVTATAIPAAGYKFTEWSGASNSKNASVTITMDNTKTLTANFLLDSVTPPPPPPDTTVEKYTVTVSSIGTGASGRGNYAVGDTVTISAGTAPTGQRFKNWISTSNGVTFANAGNTTTTFIMPANTVAVTANFEPIPSPITYTLTTNVSPTGGGSVSRSPNQTTYTSGTNVTVTATAASGYTFTGWSGASTSASSSVSITMNEDKTLTANFQQIQYTLTTNVSPTGGGSVSRSPNQTTYASGTNVTVTATVASGYTFTGWSGASTSTSSSVIITMNEDKTLTANFQQIQYTLTTNVSPTGGGSVSRSPNQTNYTSGTNVTVTATAASGYRLKNWTSSISSMAFDPRETSEIATFTMPANAVTVTANFASVIDPNTVVKGTITDSRNGQTYKTVNIGSQTWMAENLNYQPPVGNSWCYDNNTNNCNTYGRLYDWSTAQTVCPNGWHLPSNQDWDILMTAVGDSSTAGKTLKSQSDWNSYSGISSTDEYGFSALPGGLRHSNNIDVNGLFNYAGYEGYWWTATEYSSGLVYLRYMNCNYDGVGETLNFVSRGQSVRCVKDD